MAYFQNGTSGEVFHEQCARCRFGNSPCPISLVQMEFNYEAVNNKIATKIMDRLVRDDGSCTVFEMAEEFFDIERVPDSLVERAYLDLHKSKDLPSTIRELALKAAGRIT